MLLPSIDGAGMTLPALREQYRHYALTIRNVCADTAKERLRYLDCLFEHFRQPQAPPMRRRSSVTNWTHE